MTPERTLTLLEIVDLSSKSPAYAHIMGAAHDALINSILIVLPEVTKPGTPEQPISPPPGPAPHMAPSRATLADTRRS
jgi:hypothetical protein